MQRIERYGVIALVFLLVTIVAVSLWGEQKKAGGLFHFLRRDSKGAQVDRLVADTSVPARPPSRTATTRDAFGRSLPLATEPQSAPPPRAQAAPEAPYREVTSADPLVDQRESYVEPAAVPAADEMPRPAPPPVVVEPPPRRAVAATPEPQPAPSAAPRTYTVAKGDTLSEIASRELGTVRRLSEIVALNPELDPDRVLVGQVLKLPSAQGQRAASAGTPSAPAAAPPRREESVATRAYAVAKGDTLSQIASRELGTVKRLPEIVALNPELDPDHVLAGQVLRLPADVPAAATRVAAAGRPAAGSRRSGVQ